MNPQNEPISPDNLAGGEVGATAPPTEAAAPTAAEPMATATEPVMDVPVATEPAMDAPVTAEPVADTPADIESTPSAEPAMSNNTFSISPTETTAETNEPMPTGNIKLSGKKSKKGLLIAIIVLILALVGGGVAFMLWNNSDSKLVSDAWHNLFKDKNQISLNLQADIKSADDSNISLSMAVDSVSQGESAKSNAEVKISANGTSFDVKAEIISKDGDIYLKTDLGYLAEMLGDAAEYDGEWIKISKELIEQMTDQESDSSMGIVGGTITDTSTCLTEAAKALTNSVAQQDEILKVINDSNVINYQRADVDGDLITFDLALDYNDKDGAKALSESMQNTTVFKNLSACPGFDMYFNDATTYYDDEEGILPDESTAEPVPTISFTINKKTREFHGLNITSKDGDNSVVFKMTGSTSNRTDVNISAPEGDVVDITEVLEALMSGGLIESLMSIGGGYGDTPITYGCGYNYDGEDEYAAYADCVPEDYDL
ncbi:hypothetical protein FWF93_01935 [Candidatus Saccharibacteria bacterium]|nr:hypothetical protein [Candidatus Saccharibacteria bacterium]